MDDEQKKTEGVEEEVVAEVLPEVLPVAPQQKRDFRQGNRGRGGRGGGQRRSRGKEERAKPEFDQKIISIRRVSRVVAGGRRFSFAVTLVAGNRKGKVGVGTGKAGDTALAIDKAFRDAKKSAVTIPLTKNQSIPHDVQAKYAASEVILIPARGRGLVAGGAVRNVLEYAGVTDVTSKLLSRSKNGLNNARAAVKALGLIRNRK